MAEAVFQALKNSFMTATTFHDFDPEKPIIVETDAYDYITTMILSHYNGTRKLHPISFLSKKQSTVEYNYENYDKQI
jgi:hypothetical protein